MASLNEPNGDPSTDFQMQFHQQVSGQSTSRSQQNASYLSRSGKRLSRHRSHRSRSHQKSSAKSESKRRNFHQREMSFQQLHFNRGSTAINEVPQERNTNQRGHHADEPVYDYIGSPQNKYVESSEKAGCKNQTQSFSNSEGGSKLRSHKSSHRSKSADWS